MARSAPHSAALISRENDVTAAIEANERARNRRLRLASVNGQILWHFLGIFDIFDILQHWPSTYRVRARRRRSPGGGGGRAGPSPFGRPSLPSPLQLLRTVEKREEKQKTNGYCVSDRLHRRRMGHRLPQMRRRFSPHPPPPPPPPTASSATANGIETIVGFVNELVN